MTLCDRKGCDREGKVSVGTAWVCDECASTIRKDYTCFEHGVLKGSITEMVCKQIVGEFVDVRACPECIKQRLK